MKFQCFFVLCLFVITGAFVAQAQPKIYTDTERAQAAEDFTRRYVTALMAKGAAAKDQKQNIAAITIFTKVLALDPTNAQALLSRGITFYLENQYERANRDLERAVKLAPDSEGSNLHYGWTLLMLGKANAALPYLRKGMELSPDTAQFRFVLGEAELYAGNYQKCVENFDIYLNKYSGSQAAANSYLRRAECHLQMGNFEAAKTDIYQGYTLNKNGYWAYLDQIREKGDKTCKTTPEKANRKAEDLIKDGKYEESYREIWNGLKCDAKNILLLRTRLVIEARAEAMSLAARTHYFQLAAMDSETNAAVIDRFESKFGHNILLKDQGDYRYFKNVAANQQWLAHKGFEGRGFEKIDRVVIEENENFPTAEGYIKRAAKNFSEAILTSAFADRLLDLNYALFLEPNNAEALILRARTFANVPSGVLRNLAWRDATAALKINPNLSTAHTIRGIVYVREANEAEALKEFNAALEIDPNDERALMNRGFSQLALKNIDAGLSDISRAVELAPTNFIYYYNRSRVYRQLNQNEKAVADLKKVMTLSTTFSDAPIDLIKLYDSMGEKALADQLHAEFYKGNTYAINNNKIARYAEIANRNPALIAKTAADAKALADYKSEQSASQTNSQNQSKALDAYDKAMRQYLQARASYDDAVSKYNKNIKDNPNMQGLMNGTIERAKTQLEIMRSSLGNMLKEHGRNLPANLRDEANRLYAGIPSSPF